MRYLREDEEVIVIVAGSRSITSYQEVCTAIESSFYTVDCLISGGARGVDTLGEQWARAHNVPVRRFPANWKKHGKAAGFIRNEEMVDYAIEHASEWGGCAVVAAWDGESHGTEHTIRYAKSKQVPVFVYNPRVDLTVKRPKARWARP